MAATAAAAATRPACRCHLQWLWVVEVAALVLVQLGQLLVPGVVLLYAGLVVTVPVSRAVGVMAAAAARLSVVVAALIRRPSSCNELVYRLLMCTTLT